MNDKTNSSWAYQGQLLKQACDALGVDLKSDDVLSELNKKRSEMDEKTLGLLNSYNQQPKFFNSVLLEAIETG